MRLKKAVRIISILLTTIFLFFICQDSLFAKEEIFGEKKKGTESAFQKIFKVFTGVPAANRNVIGCILPFSGKYAFYGQRILHGIELSVDEFNSKTFFPPIKLEIKDSKNDPHIAAMAVKDLVYNKGVIAIIGPLLGSTAKAAAGEADKLRVPIITLTQSEGITQIGKYVFRNFLTPSLQMNALAAYSTENLELRRFAILHPENSYGRKFVSLFCNEVIIRGGEVTSILAYDKDQTDFGDVIKEMVKLPPFDEKREELGGEGEEIEEEEEKEPEPYIDFDAIFIPDSYKRVGLIAPQLAFYDVVEIYLLGTNLWNSPKLPEMAGNFLEKSIFVDGFFKESSLPVVKKFVTDFYIAFGEDPGILEAHAYDITTIIIHLLREKQVNSRRKLKEELLRINDFPGVTGTTEFISSGEARKSLNILTIKGKRIIELP